MTGLGVERQREDCLELAERKGWHVVEVYQDNDVSATTGKPRPAFERMTREIEAGRIQGIVCWDVDRLTRTPRELEDLIDWADKLGLHLASVGGEIDLATPQGRMTARIKGTVARHEIEQSSGRIRRRNAQLAKQGEHRGMRPFGWQVGPDKRLVVDPGEAAIVREAYRRLLAGEGVYTVAMDFNRRGLVTLKGNPWTTASLRSVVKRWRNCGVSIYRGEEVGQGQWEPIVDRATHERLLALLSDPSRRKGTPRGTRPRYLLSHLIHCGVCGGKLAGAGASEIQVKRANGSAVRRFPPRYVCKQAGCQSVVRRMDHIDTYVSERILANLERSGVQVLGGDSAAADDARARIEALEAKLSLAADQFADDLLTPDQLQRINAKVRPQLQTAQADLRRALPPTDGLSEFTGSTARQAWADADLDQRRMVLRALVDAGMRIDVDRSGGKPGRHARNTFNPETVRIYWPATQ